MFYPKSVLISCVYLLFSLLAFGLPKENSQSPCSTGNSTCVPKVPNLFQSILNKSLEATFRYKLKLISIGQCKLPNSKLDRSNPVNVVYKIRRVNRDTTLLDVEFQADKKVGPVFISFRGYTVKQNSIRDLIYKIEKVPCSHSVVSQFLMILQVKFDMCVIETGVHALNNINVDSLAGVLSPTIVSPGIVPYAKEKIKEKAGVVTYGEVKRMAENRETWRIGEYSTDKNTVLKL